MSPAFGMLHITIQCHFNSTKLGGEKKLAPSIVSPVGQTLWNYKVEVFTSSDFYFRALVFYNIT